MKQHLLDRFYIIAFFVINLILRTIYISHAEISINEPFIIMTAQMPLYEIPAYLAGHAYVPPLYSMLLHFIAAVFGVEVPWIRIISLFASAAAVIFIYKIGSRFFNLAIAIGASLFFTFSTFQTYFSHEASVYALFNLLAAASVYFFLLLKEEEKLKWEHVLLAIINILLIYSHYVGFILLALQFGWIFIMRLKKRRIIFLFSGIYLLCILCYIPQFQTMFSDIAEVSDIAWAPAPSIKDLYYNLMKMLNVPVVAFIAIITMAVAVILFFIQYKHPLFKAEENTSFVLHWFLSAYIGLFFISFFIPVFLERYLIFISPALYLTLAISIEKITGEEKVWPAMSIMVLFFMFSVNLRPDHNRRLQGMIKNIRQDKDKQTCVIIIPEWTALNYAYYYDLRYFKDYNNTYRLLNNDEYYTINTAADLSKFPVDSFRKIIYVDCGSEFSDKHQTAYKQLKQQYTETKTDKSFAGARIHYFEK